MEELTRLLKEYKKCDVLYDEIEKKLHEEQNIENVDEIHERRVEIGNERHDIFLDLKKIDNKINHQNIHDYIKLSLGSEIELQREMVLSLKNTEKHTEVIKKWVIFWSVISIIAFIITLLTING